MFGHVGKVVEMDSIKHLEGRLYDYSETWKMWIQLCPVFTEVRIDQKKLYVQLDCSSCSYPQLRAGCIHSMCTGHPIDL